MNKHYRVITINGFRGMVMVAFILFGLVSGFVLSPAWVCMTLWNMFVVKFTSATSMNIYQGLLFWLVIALSFYAINYKRSLICVGSYTGLTPEQIRDIVMKARKSNVQMKTEIKPVQNSEDEQNSEQKEEIRG